MNMNDISSGHTLRTDPDDIPRTDMDDILRIHRIGIETKRKYVPLSQVSMVAKTS
jgi:hypothetical protein